MKKGLTKIVFVVDRSGSMQSIASDMIGGFNKYIKKQKDNKVGECRVSFYQFDDVFEEVYKNLLIEDVKDLNDETYVPRNYTALYDAVGRTINIIGEELRNLKEDERPEKVLFIIITDGLNNASEEFSLEQVREMIKHQTEKYKWEFVYIGANQDSWSVGGSLGIVGTKTLNYVSSGKNKSISTADLWNTLGNKTVVYRCSAAATMDFSEEERNHQDKLVFNNTE